MRRPGPELVVLLLGAVAFGALLFKHLSYPLLWQDEAETLMFAERVIEDGYPKVHGERNVLYEFGANVAVGVKERIDAYIGTTWGHFYFAVPGALWARGSDDLYAKTARVRLPFAVVGAVGVLLYALAALPAFGGRPRRARLFLGLFLLAAAVSVSLLLHLREARYYALLVVLAGAIFTVHWRYAIFGGLGWAAWTASLAALLIGVFNVFFQAYFVFAALLGAERLFDAWRNGAPAGRGRRVLAGTAPFVLSFVLLAPLLVFFETFQIAASFREDLGLTFAGYTANLGEAVAHLARHELLLPALLARAAVVVVNAIARRRGARRERTPAERIAAFACVFAAGWVALTCLNPLVYERYFVLLSPLLALAFLLDAFTLADGVPAIAAPARRRGAVAATVAGLLAVVLASSGPRLESVAGRIAEVSEPYRGPLDFVIPHLAAAYPRPEELIIATNYANHSFMYYLKSHVIVGLNLSNIVNDMRLEPDVIVPRRRWPPGQRELEVLRARGRFEREEFPVRDLHFNNVPALSRTRSIPDPHHFRTAVPQRPGDQLAIYRRRP